MKKNKKGFTLVELLVVIAILAILSAITIIGYSAFVKNANEAKAEAELDQIIAYINAEFADDGKWDELDKETMTPDELQSKIINCEDFKGLSGLNNIKVTKSEGVFTISYTINGITVTDTIK